jgi:hypothetical protein
MINYNLFPLMLVLYFFCIGIGNSIGVHVSNLILIVIVMFYLL